MDLYSTLSWTHL